MSNKLTTSTSSYILLINDQIDAVTSSWDDMRNYCAETSKRGKVYLINTKIPFGGSIHEVKTSTALYAEID